MLFPAHKTTYDHLDCVVKSQVPSRDRNTIACGVRHKIAAFCKWETINPVFHSAVCHRILQSPPSRDAPRIEKHPSIYRRFKVIT